MEKNIVVYNNSTGIIEAMGALLGGEGLKMLIASEWINLLQILDDEDIHLILIDVELDGTGLGTGIEMIQKLRKKTAIPIIV
ncbi:MAG: hypothetical protein J5988_13620, partial [Eubacterium sp.]|nr:hypothetical protein [Eubacterium sp.]